VSHLAILLRVSAKLTAPHRYDLMHMVPGTGSERASAFVVAAAEEAAGVPIVRGDRPVNIARVRAHLREHCGRTRR
jgi:hypothetical protein